MRSPPFSSTCSTTALFLFCIKRLTSHFYTSLLTHRYQLEDVIVDEFVLQQSISEKNYDLIKTQILENRKIKYEMNNRK